MGKDRQNLIEDKEALQDVIKRSLSMTPPDKEEAERLIKHLNWLENYLGEQK